MVVGATNVVVGLRFSGHGARAGVEGACVTRRALLQGRHSLPPLAVAPYVVARPEHPTLYRDAFVCIAYFSSPPMVIRGIGNSQQPPRPE